MKTSLSCITAAVLVCFFGCDPDDVPCISADGKCAAVLVPSTQIKASELIEAPMDVAVVTLATKKTVVYPLPAGWSAYGVQWADDRRLLVASNRKMVGKRPTPGGPKLDTAFWVTDVKADAQHRFLKTAMHQSGFTPPFIGVFGDQKAIYQQDDKRTVIFALDGSTKLGHLPFEAEPAGDGWYYREVDKKSRDGMTAEIVYVDVFTPAGKKAVRIEKSEIAKASYRRPRNPLCARISDDHQIIVMGFDTQTMFRRHPCEYTYGVFSLKTGELLWDGASNGLRGLPVVVDNAIYALEAKSKSIYTGERTVAAVVEPPLPTSQSTSEIVLARHTKEGRSVVMQVPLRDKEKATRYSASTDRKTLVLFVEGNSPRLLLIPVGDAVKASDVQSVDLKL